MKRILSLILVFAISMNVLSFVVSADEIDEETLEIEKIEQEVKEASADVVKEPNINAKAAIVMDRSSKKVLYNKSVNERRAMASTTKIMTCIVAIEFGNLNDTVTISKRAAGTGGSVLGIKTDDKIMLKELLYALMICSANDAAVAIAEHVGGSVEGFIEMMNEKAKELNLVNTHFVTPHGLDAEEHYTTSYELAIMADYALNVPIIAEIVAQKQAHVYINGIARKISNTNHLLGSVAGVNGMKTGFTVDAGRCLVTTVNRNGWEMIIVVLGSDTSNLRTKDSITLLEYAYKNFERINVQELARNNTGRNTIKIEKGEESKIEIALKKMEDNLVPIKKEDRHKIRLEYKIDSYKVAPVKKEEPVGNVKIFIENDEIATGEIVATKEVKRKTVFKYIIESLEKIAI